MAFRETTKIGMPLAEFLLLNSQEGEFELINGERIPRVPTVSGHSYSTRAVFRPLDQFTLATGTGEAFSETTFILPDAYDADWVSGSRTPDVMFIAAEPLAEFRAKWPDWSARLYAIVPTFVVEVISPTDRYSDVDEKVDLYRADGVRLIWVVDPQRHKVAVYTQDSDVPVMYRPGGILSGGDVLPGFELTVADIFPK
jgi:Uma2 family endonuclease